MLESIAWGIAVGVLCMIAAGIRRWPWRWCAVTGLGFALVLATLRLSTLDPTLEPSMAILVGALGGSVAAIGSERGERDRRIRSNAILGSP